MTLSNATLDLSQGREVETSQAAFAKVVLSGFKDRDVILDVIRHDELGVTLKELALVMWKEKNCISGRITELHSTGRIFDTGRRRDGCRVWKATYQGAKE
jgi:hypothetical protein